MRYGQLKKRFKRKYGMLIKVTCKDSRGRQMRDASMQATVSVMLGILDSRVRFD